MKCDNCDCCAAQNHLCNDCVNAEETARKETESLWREIKRYLNMPSKTWDRIKEKYNLK